MSSFPLAAVFQVAVTEATAGQISLFIWGSCSRLPQAIR